MLCHVLGGFEMTATIAEMEQQVRMLSPDERARLAEIVLETLQVPPLSDIEAAWNREIKIRVAAYDKGDTETYLAEDVFAEAKHITR